MEKSRTWAGRRDALVLTPRGGAKRAANPSEASEAWYGGGDRSVHREGDLEAVRSLVEEEADVEAVAADGCRPLHVAAHHEHVEVVRTLLEAGADVEVQAADGARPLFIAAANG